MLRLVSIAALIVAGAITTAQADVYRWVDEHGQPHYSDQWVPGSEIIKTGKSHPPGAENSARSVDQKSLSAANQRVDAQLEPLVISHREGCNAADHAEDRREQRTLVPEQQGYADQEGGDASEGREGEPIPAHARHDRPRLLKIDDDSPH